ncbi:bis(5'-nucleosyl)-tetraphosphatase PrpE [Alkalihalobacillus sp. BA299]|uniref:bis(5'-nucleosyl)-tetraphosphatase PrpE n=1 Tax=Alkalihalobacillus sp. BA299 TaxID=2815938 RepID=UPI001AD99BCD|nr:bis(5'-nucleosyl)-tetraphosphatase PrpE [Alkalihalobacillus sp. BA299]
MPIDIIGDIHGCYDEFVQLTEKLGYDWSENIPIHPTGRKLAFVGDLTDRGPHSVKVIEIVYELVNRKLAYYVPGNHCDKLYRYFLGRNVQTTHGLETTVAELEQLSRKEYNAISAKFRKLVENSNLYAVLDDGKLVIAHAGIRQDYIGRHDKKVKTFVLYGDITGEKHPDGSPVRRDWAKNYSGEAWIVYGHTPVAEPRFIHNTVNIDTGCVFGGKLTALRYPELETVSVPSSMPHVGEKFRAFDDTLE